jgi:hypothetical protein
MISARVMSPAIMVVTKAKVLPVRLGLSLEATTPLPEAVSQPYCSHWNCVFTLKRHEKAYEGLEQVNLRVKIPGGGSEWLEGPVCEPARHFVHAEYMEGRFEDFVQRCAEKLAEAERLRDQLTRLQLLMWLIGRGAITPSNALPYLAANPTMAYEHVETPNVESKTVQWLSAAPKTRLGDGRNGDLQRAMEELDLDEDL